MSSLQGKESVEAGDQETGGGRAGDRGRDGMEGRKEDRREGRRRD